MPTDTFFTCRRKTKAHFKCGEKRIFQAAFERRLDRQHHQRCRNSSGSFYQYFENKEDLYYYYFHTLKKIVSVTC